MKHKTIFFLTMLMIASIQISAQWAGSSTTSNSIYRYGKMGIGLSNPNHEIDVHSSTSSPVIQVRNTNARLELGVANHYNAFSKLANTDDVIIRGDGGGTGDLIITNQGNEDIIFGIGTVNNDDEIMRLNNSGEVTIGTGVNTPGDYKLYVEDGILTEKVRVAVKNASQWADYVFSDDYDLLDLKNLESYIKEHKHLPNIPSSEEVVKDGIDLGVINAKLLEKIEELTLYTIDLSKKIEILENNKINK